MSYLRTPNTYQKCQKILNMFQQIGNQSSHNKHNSRPSSKSKPTYYLSQSTAKKPSSKALLTKTTSASKSILKNNTTFMNQSQTNVKPRESSIFREKSNSSFVSCYKKESRLEQIMKLKVNKPSHAGVKPNKAMLLNSSLTSLNSSRSSLNKQNQSINCNKESRLQKIMNIKIQKPKVNSTLIGYQPKKAERSSSKSLSKKNSFLGGDISSLIELKECKKHIKKSQQISQKQDRLWKLFQRERQQQLNAKKKQAENQYKDQRRKQEKFEKLVQKELRKIENSRQISLRKEKGFSQYVYPSY